MSEIHESPPLRVKMIGLPIDAQQEERLQTRLYEAIVKTSGRAIEKEVKTYRPADLTPEEHELLRQAEGRIHTYFTHKKGSLGLPSSLHWPLPEVSYVRSPIKVKGKSLADGAAFSALGFPLVYIDKTKDLLGAGITAAHELSHLATQRELWAYWKDQVKEKPTITKAVVKTGAESIANQELLGSGIENGLAILDSVDTYYAALQSLFPKEARERKEALSSKHIQRELKRLDRSLFGPVDRSLIEPFLIFYPAPIVGKLAMIDERSWQNARIVEELCRTIAYATHGAIEEAKEMLDKDRFTGTHDGLREIVRIFGKEDALSLLRLKDDGKNLGQAMKLIRAKQRALGRQQ